MSKSMCDAIVALSAVLTETLAKSEEQAKVHASLAAEYAATCEELRDHKRWANERIDSLYESLDARHREVRTLEDKFLDKVSELRAVQEQLRALTDKPSPVPNGDQEALYAYMKESVLNGSLVKSKIDTIKEVRNMTGCGLRHAKDYVEAYIGAFQHGAALPAWPQF